MIFWLASRCGVLKIKIQYPKDPVVRHVVFRCTKQQGMGYRAKYQRLSDADATIHSYAVRHADEIRDAFVFKNLKKLVSIIQGKGVLKRSGDRIFRGQPSRTHWVASLPFPGWIAICGRQFGGPFNQYPWQGLLAFPVDIP